MQQTIPLDFEVIAPKKVVKVKWDKRKPCSLTNNQRYYLHRKIKAFAQSFIFRNRSGVIFIPHNFEVSSKQKEYLEKLKMIGYSVESVINSKQ